MILLDTHIWVKWVLDEKQLPESVQRQILEHEEDGLGVSVISCWEVAKLLELKRLNLDTDVSDWINQALSYPGIQLVELSPSIAVESTRLPGEFHRDPADQLIVATARIHDCPLLTLDRKILAYSHVKLL
ncbi:MAG: type II toxin-antitoxin system VapC family toxin [Candidatus Electronema sp. V4]|uniref:type II toxin-antitoxin system VapC family toxin n=1 Tax=Candidatus Electronema sp. V4 TaxID=3454756 RepID=UPI0040555845